MGSILIISKRGRGVTLAIRLVQEKNICKVFIKEVDSETKHLLKGYKNPSVIGSPRMLKQYDMILYDDTGLGHIAKEMKEDNLILIAGNSLNDSLELNREYAEKVVKKLTTLKIPESLIAKRKDKDSIISLLKSAGEPYRIKLVDRISNLTLMSKTNNNEMLISLIEQQSDKVFPCIFQKHIQGIEVLTEGWFNGSRFINFNHSIEYKRLMEGDTGPLVNCMGNITWICDEDKIVEEALLPLIPLLEKAEYKGPIGVRSICNENDCYFISFIPRINYDSIYALIELMYDSFYNFLWRVASGSGQPRMRKEYAISVRMGFPPFPVYDKNQLEMIRGLRVLSLPEKAMKHIYLNDVMLNNDCEVIAGSSGLLGCVTARGETIQEVRRRAYRTLRSITISEDVIYRKDIGAKVEYKIGKLKEWGWLDA